MTASGDPVRVGDRLRRPGQFEAGGIVALEEIPGIGLRLPAVPLRSPIGGAHAKPVRLDLVMPSIS